jgi:hypothetical protein
VIGDGIVGQLDNPAGLVGSLRCVISGINRIQEDLAKLRGLGRVGHGSKPCRIR